MEEKENIPVGQNSQREANNTQCACGRVEGTIIKGDSDDSWWINSQKDTSDIKLVPCFVQVLIEETEMIPVGLNSQKEASNNQQTNGPVEDML